MPPKKKIPSIEAMQVVLDNSKGSSKALSEFIGIDPSRLNRQLAIHGLKMIIRKEIVDIIDIEDTK